MQILLICQYYFVFSKKKYIKKPKKKQKLNWNTEARNRTWAVCVRVRYRSLTPLQKFNEFAYNYFKSHCIIMNYFFICFFNSL